MNREITMSEIDVPTEWQKLCDEHEAAKNAYFEAFSAVNQKFSTIARRASKGNPSRGELSEFETTWKTWEDVKQRMNHFVKTYA
jgi:uncharacterized protein YdeI (YjbR/CyaY-like superfamily)